MGDGPYRIVSHCERYGVVSLRIDSQLHWAVVNLDAYQSYRLTKLGGVTLDIYDNREHAINHCARMNNPGAEKMVDGTGL